MGFDNARLCHNCLLKSVSSLSESVNPSCHVVHIVYGMLFVFGAPKEPLYCFQRLTYVLFISLYIYTVESHYDIIAYSQCLSIVKYFTSPSKSCILYYIQYSDHEYLI